MHYFADYGLFLAKAVTLIMTFLILAGGLAALANKSKERNRERLEISKLNEKYDDMAEAINKELLTKEDLKRYLKEKKKINKAREADKNRKRIFVLDFEGDIKASAVNTLREEITSILNIVTSRDEVVLRLESHGGLVHAYGLAASQLMRIRKRNIPLIVAVDKIAASGGYLMACVANRILAAPFAIIGSIGVLAQIPNFHRLLKKNDIDFEQITAGEYKRTVSIFGENTEKAKQKFKEELTEVHEQFKDFIHENRPEINIEKIATGEHWLAERALELKLVDELATSDDYLMQASKHAELYRIQYYIKPTLSERLATSIQAAGRKMLSLWHEQTQHSSYF